VNRYCEVAPIKLGRDILGEEVYGNIIFRVKFEGIVREML